MDIAFYDDTIVGDEFPTRPSRDFIAAFLAHIRQTNDPISYDGLSTNQPQLGSNVELLTHFELSSKVEMAPCAICCSKHPKYRTGWLAWFPDDQRVRVIGQNCGERHLKDFRKATRRYRAERKAEADRGIIEAAILKLPDIKKEFAKAQDASKKLKPIANAMQSAFGKNIRAIRLDLRQNEWRYRRVIDRYDDGIFEGRSRDRYSFEVIGPVRGVLLWQNRIILSSRAKAGAVIDRYGSLPENSTVEEILDILKINPSRYDEVAKLINDTYRMVINDNRNLQKEWAFFEKAHFSHANEWLASSGEFANFELIHPSDNSGVFSIHNGRKQIAVARISAV